MAGDHGSGGGGKASGKGWAIAVAALIIFLVGAEWAHQRDQAIVGAPNSGRAAFVPLTAPARSPTGARPVVLVAPNGHVYRLGDRCPMSAPHRGEIGYVWLDKQCHLLPPRG